VSGKITPIFTRKTVILGKNIALDFYHAGLAQTRRMCACGTAPKIYRGVRMNMLIRLGMGSVFVMHTIFHLRTGFVIPLERTPSD
jgi:hypothetical protein